MDPWLLGSAPVTRSQLLLGFAARTRSGGFFDKVGRWAPKPSSKLCTTWIKPCCWRTPQATPDKASPDQTWLCPSRTSLVHPLRHPALTSQYCAPCPAAAVRHEATASPSKTTTVHLILMMFCILLRVGKHTLPPKHCTTALRSFVSDAASFLEKPNPAPVDQ
jgi:hypothetical protein